MVSDDRFVPSKTPDESRQHMKWLYRRKIFLILMATKALEQPAGNTIYSSANSCMISGSSILDRIELVLTASRFTLAC